MVIVHYFKIFAGHLFLFGTANMLKNSDKKANFAVQFLFCMQIGNITFDKYPLFLAPMENVTDLSFRKLCKKFGVAMLYTEFVAADALIRSVPSTERKLHIEDCERPVAIQLYGREPDTMVKAACVAQEAKPDVIDLNFGCPVKKVAGKGAGAGLLRDVPKMLEITREVVKAVNIPVTAKTRLGWDESNKIIVDLAEQLQDCGISALTIHGRTRAQMYTGTADWTLIGEVKNNPRMHIPVIGNGDVNTPERAKECFDRYGVDAVMIGRASFGRPWVFQEMKHFLETGERFDSSTSLTDRSAQRPFDWYLNILKEQVIENCNEIGERRGILHIRRHLASSPIFKGIPNFKETRIAMLRANTLSELFEIFQRVAEMMRNLL